MPFEGWSHFLQVKSPWSYNTVVVQVLVWRFQLSLRGGGGKLFQARLRGGGSQGGGQT